MWVDKTQTSCSWLRIPGSLTVGVKDLCSHRLSNFILMCSWINQDLGDMDSDGLGRVTGLSGLSQRGFPTFMIL